MTSDNIARLTPDVVHFNLESSLPSSFQGASESAGSLPCIVIKPKQEEFSNLTLSIRNSGEPIQIEGKLQVYEDLGNGMHNSRAINKFLWNGALEFSSKVSIIIYYTLLYPSLMNF